MSPTYGEPGPRKLIVDGVVIGWFEATGDTEKDMEIATALRRKLGHERPELPLWMHIRQQAMDFRDACGLIMNFDVGKRPPGRRPLSIPYVVNTAFCLELYLKALSLRHGTDQKGHDLLRLFDRLPADAKDVIQGCIPGARDEANYDGTVDVRLFLSVIKDNFVQWRYAHEHANLGTLTMPQLFFLRALFHRCCLNEPPVS